MRCGPVQVRPSHSIHLRLVHADVRMYVVADLAHRLAYRTECEDLRRQLTDACAAAEVPLPPLPEYSLPPALIHLAGQS